MGAHGLYQDTAVYSAGGEVLTLAFGVSSCGPQAACQGALFYVGQETSDMGRDPLALLAEAIASAPLTGHSGRLLGN